MPSPTTANSPGRKSAGSSATTTRTHKHMSLPKFYSINEVAESFRVHPATVRKMISRKEIRALQIGEKGTIRIPEAEILKLYSPQERQPEEKQGAVYKAHPPGYEFDGLNRRAKNILRMCDINTVEELAQWRRRDITKLVGVGETTADAMADWLRRQGKSFRL